MENINICFYFSKSSEVHAQMEAEDSIVLPQKDFMFEQINSND